MLLFEILLGIYEKRYLPGENFLEFYGKIQHFKMLFVSTADKICPQAQKNT